MKSPPLLILAGLALALSAGSLAAQSSDDGLSSNALGKIVVGGNSNRGVGCGTGTTTTFFATNNGFAGNMVDLAIGGSDMTLECLDVNCTSVAGTQVDIEVWVVPVTAVGKDLGDLCANGWTMIGSGTGVAAGTNLPTAINLNSTFVFNAGQTYGLYINFANYSTSRCGYTNGAAPTTYTGTHCDLTTLYGKATFTPPCTAGSTFSIREFNGTLYTDVAGPPAFTLAQSGTCGAGSVTLSTSNGTPNTNVAYIYGNAGTKTKPGGVCAGTTVSIANPKKLAIAAGNPGGTTAFTFNPPPALCGQTIQAVLVGPGPCTTSNTIVL